MALTIVTSCVALILGTESELGWKVLHLLSDLIWTSQFVVEWIRFLKLHLLWYSAVDITHTLFTS